MHRLTSVLAAAALLLPAVAQAAPPARAAHGMVATSEHNASDVGVDVLMHGGNAVDAAVAVGYALAVVHPCCGNLGGGGFATIHLANGKDTVISFRERAPEAATPGMFLDAGGKAAPERSRLGYEAVATPGTVLGLETMLARYGTMSRARVMAPAIRLAQEGYVLGPGDVQLMSDQAAHFAARPNVAAIFLHDGKPWKVGERFVQHDLARTLKLIETNGADAFYKGEIADAVVAASQSGGGLLSKQDFLDYTVTENAPVRCAYRGYDIVSAAPPSSGGVTMCEILTVVNGYPLHDYGFNSPASVHVLAEAMRHAFADRNSRLGDPAFVRNPIEDLLSESHAAAIRASIKPDAATPSSAIRLESSNREGTETTHVSIVDRYGNAVALTLTLNLNFGAKVIAGHTGFFLNNTMDDFSAGEGAANYFGLVEGANNRIQPGKRPLSAMTPTILLKGGKVFMVIGSPGGPRIITTVVQAISNVVDHGMDIQEAVDAPRIHQQWLPDTVFMEPGAIGEADQKALKTMGYTLTAEAPWSDAEGIVIQPQAGPTGSQDVVLLGGHDKRRPGSAAAGY
jgi:gamma-glutamyltranspeptidase/glutathione hydrolase